MGKQERRRLPQVVVDVKFTLDRAREAMKYINIEAGKYLDKDPDRGDLLSNFLIEHQIEASLIARRMVKDLALMPKIFDFLSRKVVASGLARIASVGRGMQDYMPGTEEARALVPLPYMSECIPGGEMSLEKFLGCELGGRHAISRMAVCSLIAAISLCIYYDKKQVRA